MWHVAAALQVGAEGEETMSVSRKTWFLLSAAVLMSPTVVVAQDSAPSTTSPQGSGSEDADAADEQGGLTEIIVTAQQRGENLQKAAVPVSVVTGEDLRESGIVGVDTLQKNVPAVLVGNGSTGNAIFIRGALIIREKTTESENIG